MGEYGESGGGRWEYGVVISNVDYHDVIYSIGEYGEYGESTPLENIGNHGVGIWGIRGWSYEM